MNYNDIIEYIDDTFDENFARAKEWCKNNNADLTELIERRVEHDGKLFRYFQIQEIITPAPTEDELKAQVRAVRDAYLQHYDFTQLPDAPFNEVEKAQYADYRQYLRDYTMLPNWWLSNPKTFEEWCAE